MTDPAQHSQTPKPRRCWLRYSLASLFVVVSGACVVLAFWVVPAERQKRTVVEIQNAGGTVIYDFEDANKKSPQPEVIASLLGVDYVATPAWISFGMSTTDGQILAASQLKEVTGLDFLGATLNDTTLALFAHHTEVRELYLDGTGVTAAGLSTCANMPHLAVLSLGDTKIGDEGVPYLRRIESLSSLALVNTPLTDVGLEALQSCTNLRWLGVGGTAVTSAGVARFRERSPKCVVDWSSGD